MHGRWSETKSFEVSRGAIGSVILESYAVETHSSSNPAIVSCSETRDFDILFHTFN